MLPWNTNLKRKAIKGKMDVDADRTAAIKTKSPRGLFEDGANSFWHVVFGMAAYHVKLGALVYAAYQMYDFDDANFSVDMLEFLVGYVAMYTIDCCVRLHGWKMV